MIETTLDGKTKDITQDNIEQLKQLFPEIVTEDKIDFDKLREVLGEEINEDEERYDFKWEEKHKAIKTSQTPSEGTLRPIKQDSRNWDNTDNLYIEGDNLEVLKILQKSYYNKIKMIYLDPPYNTGNDFVYEDNFTESLKNYLKQDAEGFKISSNPETSGRYHTNWLNMIYPRLKLARTLLKQDGTIFISIDDNEVFNLKKICDEIFGERNFVANFIWRGGKRNTAKHVSKSHEYMLCYVKDLAYCNKKNISWHQRKNGIEEIYLKVNELTELYGSDYNEISNKLKEWYKKLNIDNPSKDHSHYDWVDERGVYFASDISRGGGNGPQWDIKNPYTNEYVKKPSRGYAYSNKEDLIKDIEDGLIHFNGTNVPCKKRYLKDNETQLIETVFYKDRRGSSKRLKKLFGKKIFDFPKDETVIKNFIASFTEKNDIILDLFAGSSTTAHSVIKLNSEEDSTRKFIMIQLPEKTDEKSEAYKEGFKNICEIGEERIRRAGDKLLKENPDANIDIGFKVFKLDSSNLTKWNPDVDNLEDSLKDASDNIVKGRSEIDLVYEIILKYGIELTADIEKIAFYNYNFYSVNMGSLVICLNENIKRDIAESVLKIKEDKSPDIMRVVFKDNGFNSDCDKTNVKEILRNNEVDEFITI